MTELERLQARCTRLEQTLGSLISWIAGSANSPISAQEAKMLLDSLTRSLLQEAHRG